MPKLRQLEVNRQDLAQTRVLDADMPELAPGQVRMRVERFALTANTMTYALTGDLLGYWNFFPGPDPGWGRVPAMGWAELVASRHPDLPVGGRYYGWFPMASHVDFQASPTAEGFRDDGGHRQGHAPIYRAYTETARDPLYEAGADAESRHALLRGLMQTAFLADEALADRQYHGASSVLVTSASSKTAIAFAERASLRPGLRVIGLTSPGNREFVASLSCYEEVVTYPDVSSIDAAQPSVIVDMAGDTGLLARLHAHLGAGLRHSMAIGRSHHDAPRQQIAGEIQPEFFFAPTQAQTLLKRWGSARYFASVAEALAAHVAGSRKWLQIEAVRGAGAIEQAWQELHAGRVAPSRGLIACFE